MKTSLVLETDDKTNKDTRLSLCWIVASVIALLSGLIMFLVFCHVLIVPHMKTKDYVTTDCVVDTISIIPETTNVSCSDSSRKREPLKLHADTSKCEITLNNEQSSENILLSSTQDQDESSHCVQVKVLHKAFDGFVHETMLQNQPKEEGNSEGTKISEKVSWIILLNVGFYSFHF